MRDVAGMKTLLLALCGALIFAAAAAAGTSTSRPGAAGAADQATLTVSIAGQGAGSVTSDPAGISCGTICSAQFAVGTVVKLVAQAAAGSQFDGLEGTELTATCVGGKNIPGHLCSYTVTLTGDASVQATFSVVPPCVVPRVKGYILYVAKQRLRSGRCQVGTVRHVFSRKVEKTIVISQNPRRGAQLANGARVNLVVSKGRRRAR